MCQPEQAECCGGHPQSRLPSGCVSLGAHLSSLRASGFGALGLLTASAGLGLRLQLGPFLLPGFAGRVPAGGGGGGGAVAQALGFPDQFLLCLHSAAAHSQPWQGRGQWDPRAKDSGSRVSSQWGRKTSWPGSEPHLLMRLCFLEAHQEPSGRSCCKGWHPPCPAVSTLVCRASKPCCTWEVDGPSCCSAAQRGHVCRVLGPLTVVLHADPGWLLLPWICASPRAARVYLPPLVVQARQLSTTPLKTPKPPGHRMPGSPSQARLSQAAGVKQRPTRCRLSLKAFWVAVSGSRPPPVPCGKLGQQPQPSPLDERSLSSSPAPPDRAAQVPDCRLVRGLVTHGVHAYLWRCRHSR